MPKVINLRWKMEDGRWWRGGMSKAFGQTTMEALVEYRGIRIDITASHRPLSPYNHSTGYLSGATACPSNIAGSVDGTLTNNDRFRKAEFLLDFEPVLPGNPAFSV